MESELQKITDTLGSQLGRSVAIDDRQMHLLAYSPHYGAVDDARLGSILHRVAPEAAVRWVMTLGIDKATEPMRTPANPELEIFSRMCVPIIHRRLKLGYLWLIDADESLTSEEIAAAAAAADAAGAALYRESLVVQLERGRERELLRDLFAQESEVRRLAAMQLVEEELFAPSGPVQVFVVRCVEMLDDEGARVAFDTALTQTRRQLPGRHAIHLTRPDHGMLLLSTKGRLTTAAAQTELADHVLADIKRSCEPTVDVHPIIGIGDRQRDLLDASSSYEQAQMAAHVAQVIHAPGGVARWADLGVYRTLAKLPADEFTTTTLEPGIVRLLEADKDGTLLRTLECFLDLAGSAKRAAQELNLHRTSLYYRLSKVQEITKLNLDNGNDRLALHLGLKMARLAGVHPDERPNGS